MVISCPECGGKVSTTATACPHCGAPNPSTWASIQERPAQEPLRSVQESLALPPPPPPPTPPAQETTNIITVEEKPRFWRRMMAKRQTRVIVVTQPKMLADKIITPTRTFQHGAAGGFGLSFGWAMGGCAAAAVMLLMLCGIGYGIYLYTTRHTLSNAGNPIPMEKKVHGANSCPRCDGVGYVEAQGNGIGMKCPRCNGSGFR